jgi:transcriptional regulator with XRE-family HTH domain
MSVLKFGRQLQAARALAGLDRAGLAEAAGLSTFTVRKLEQQERITAFSTTLDALEKALAEAGVELIGGDEPGVKLRKREPSAARNERTTRPP